jgi:SWI/SNF-related matrix-associated actin-dependent regulator of chromatin subfamily B protein 1
MWRRLLTIEERKQLSQKSKFSFQPFHQMNVKQGVRHLLYSLSFSEVELGPQSLATNITLLKATEVDEIFDGKDDKFKAMSAPVDVSMSRYVISANSLLIIVSIISYSSTRSESKSKRQSGWVPTVPSSSHHLDAVPCSTPINRNRLGRPKVRSYPMM